MGQRLLPLLLETTIRTKTAQAAVPCSSFRFLQNPLTPGTADMLRGVERSSVSQKRLQVSDRGVKGVLARFEDGMRSPSEAQLKNQVKSPRRTYKHKPVLIGSIKQQSR